MRMLIQRVSKASVSVEQQVIGQISHGLLLFVGFKKSDTTQNVDQITQKLLNLRIFPSKGYPLNQSILDIQGQILVVSQFTLYADTKGRRPSFSDALEPKAAQSLHHYLITKLKASNLTISSGQFGSHMEVSLTNDGPVTILLEN